MGTIVSLLDKSFFGRSSLGINDLNDDVLLMIFTYLNLKERTVVSGVCIRWFSLISKLFCCQSSLVFTRHSDLQWKYCTNSSIVSTYMNGFSYISLPSNFNDKTVIAKLLSKCSNLKSVQFIGIYFENNSSPLKIIMNSCQSDLIHCNFVHVLNERSNLQDVRISINSEEMRQFVMKYPNIRHFVILGSWFRFTEESLSILIKGFKDLQILSLAKHTICDSETEINGHYFDYINENISVLKITKQILGINGLTILCKRLKSIIKFRVDIISSVSETKLISSHLMNLKSLSFEFCIPKENQTQAFVMLSQLTNLEELNISMGKELELNVIDSDLMIIMNKCHSMKKFRFKGSITDTPIKIIDICWPRLEKLSIIPKNKDSLTDHSLPIIEKLQNLTYLDVRDSRIGDNLIRVINSCPNLRFINVCGSRVTDVLLEAFINVAKSNPKFEYQIKSARTNISRKYNQQLFLSNFSIY